jgi:uroporphyrinogen-III synthase
MAPPPALRLLVTRPQPQADAWVQALRAGGADAHALPLLAIEAEPAASLAPAWRRLHDQALVVFVSPNAVASFFAARPADADWPTALAAASPGPGSDDALRDAGVPQRIAPDDDADSFDSDALWLRLQARDWRDASVLIVRGDGGRDTLASHLRAAGARVEYLQAYRRRAPAWTQAQHALYAEAAQRPALHRWLLSSTQALAHLPAADRRHWHGWASHPRIAQAARDEFGFGEVRLLRAGVAGVLEAAAQ